MKDFVAQKNQEKSMRIHKIREYFCYGKNIEFANKLGIKPNHASSICNGKVSVGAETVEKVLIAFPEVSRHWLLTGEGSMLTPSSQMPPTPPAPASTSSNSIPPADPATLALLSAKDSLIDSLRAQLASQELVINTQRQLIARLERTLKDYED